MKYRIIHNTSYKYSAPASLSQNELLLHPRRTPSQEVLSCQLSIVPKPQYLHCRTDYFGNTVHVFMVQHPHNELAMSATSIVRTSRPVIPEPNDATAPYEIVAQRLAERRQLIELEASQFVFASPLVTVNATATDYARQSFPPGTPVLVGATDLVRRIFTEFAYDKNASTVDTTVEQVLINRKGVCQDFAHLAISCLRGLGLAARYVSGYMETVPPPGKPKLVGADASHAWISVFLPDFGWVDLDPTNNLIVNESYITVAWGRDYGDVAPVKGVVMGGGAHMLSVMVDVARQEEALV
ncbi:transglutaminase family protein [Desulfopila sp. IMCC35006]|uniref:transglutaminase family protein n=1 Tax=Desulfopila sp. IMCC35006 TaxID=2569542 RepID=UPI0010AB61EE|nr:transglutaminase family protein [Desulfopila sp. IMCC35006]TKB23646.1 transglutaminase family protein [Desulfopila sp. IMCC35006]